MKKLLLVGCLVLSGCAGVEVGNPNSPAAQRMRASIQQSVASVGQGIGAGLAELSSPERAIERQLEDADWELMRARQQQEAAASDTRRRLDDIRSAQVRMQNDLDTQESRTRLERLGIRLP